MKYLVAVSGGIDSVVLLHLLVATRKHDLVVAHFDHGIRSDSAADARFVMALAASYGLPSVTKREELGEGASEQLARERRYIFLKDQAKKLGATIVTAHHTDDVIETIALNLTRGTGWRGLAVMDTPAIRRPLLAYSKEELRQYALKKRLEWVEDSTNSSTMYLRNQLRRRIAQELPPENIEKLVALWERQLTIKQAVDDETEEQLKNQQAAYSRYFFTQIDTAAAIELLRAIAVHTLGHSLTRPQLLRALVAIKTARPGSLFPFGEHQLVFGKKVFSLSVKTP